MIQEFLITIDNHLLNYFKPDENIVLLGENKTLYRYNDRWEYLKTIDNSKGIPVLLWSHDQFNTINKLQEITIGNSKNLYYTIIPDKDENNYMLWYKHNNEWYHYNDNKQWVKEDCDINKYYSFINVNCKGGNMNHSNWGEIHCD
tara:strand:+ start:1142 stop:1576 length:435 start_codon:yes stop_codon:yes gene_type:complete